MTITRRDFLKIFGLSSGAVLLKACRAGERPPHGDPISDGYLPDGPTADVITAIDPTISDLLPEHAEAWQPAYMHLEAQGEFAGRIEQAYAILEECRLCPRRCGVNRLAGEHGFFLCRGCILFLSPAFMLHLPSFN
ncbi:MAG: hypothetical protein IBX69_07865 [Anaerolineales bacterium]|nr:hypothetical protein [Anaerolineales bacterium]